MTLIRAFLPLLLVIHVLLAVCPSRVHSQPSVANQDFGHLQIDCEPDVAVYLDGVFAGTTQPTKPALIIQRVPAGRRALRAVKAGFLPHEVVITVEKDAVLQHVVRSFIPDVTVKQEGDNTGGAIARALGAIMIQTLPIECSITIPTLRIRPGGNDGIKQSDKWMAEKVPTGTHPTELSAGGTTIRVNVEVYPERRTQVMVNFLDGSVTQRLVPLNRPPIVPLETVTNSVGMKLSRIPAGTYQMGSADGEPDESPPRNVTFSRPFFMSLTEVTQEQWQKVMGTNPSHFKGPELPVEMISWHDATRFCAKLSERESMNYRLPTEAEWEYVCRAGSTTDFYWGNTFDAMYAVTSHDSNGQPKTVGSLEPNRWGFFDTSGNVWEWCEDWYDEYTDGQVSNPTGPAEGRHKVLRGGSWFSYPHRTKSANRINSDPEARLNYVGFRVVVEAKTK